MYALCVSDAVDTQAFVHHILLSFLRSFIHSSLSADNDPCLANGHTPTSPGWSCSHSMSTHSPLQADLAVIQCLHTHLSRLILQSFNDYTLTSPGWSRSLSMSTHPPLQADLAVIQWLHTHLSRLILKSFSVYTPTSPGWSCTVWYRWGPGDRRFGTNVCDVFWNPETKQQRKTRINVIILEYFLWIDWLTDWLVEEFAVITIVSIICNDHFPWHSACSWRKSLTPKNK